MVSPGGIRAFRAKWEYLSWVEDKMNEVEAEGNKWRCWGQLRVLWFEMPEVTVGSWGDLS